MNRKMSPRTVRPSVIDAVDVAVFESVYGTVHQAVRESVNGAVERDVVVAVERAVSGAVNQSVEDAIRMIVSLANHASPHPNLDRFLKDANPITADPLTTPNGPDA